MPSLVAEKPAASTASQGSEKAAVLLGHGRSVGVVVGSVGVRGLSRSLRVLLRAALAALVTVHPSLIGVICIVGGLALRIGLIVGAILVSLLAVLKAAVLGRTEAVLTSGRTEVLILVVLLAVALLLLVAVALVIALLRRVTLVVALLRWIAALLLVSAVAATATVRIVGTRHCV